MKPRVRFLTVLAPVVAAADLAAVQQALPACSLGCIADGVQAHGCGLGQFACQCGRLEPIIRTVAPCLAKMGCSLENMTETARVVMDLCQEVAPDRVGASAVAATARAAASEATPTNMALRLATGAIAAAILMRY